jgi:hypothetical protein
MEIDSRMEQLGYLAEGSHSHGWGTMQLAIAHAELQKLGGEKSRRKVSAAFAARERLAGVWANHAEGEGAGMVVPAFTTAIPPPMSPARPGRAAGPPGITSILPTLGQRLIVPADSVGTAASPPPPQAPAECPSLPAASARTGADDVIVSSARGCSGEWNGDVPKVGGLSSSGPGSAGESFHGASFDGASSDPDAVPRFMQERLEGSLLAGSSSWGVVHSHLFEGFATIACTADCIADCNGDCNGRHDSGESFISLQELVALKAKNHSD